MSASIDCTQWFSFGDSPSGDKTVEFVNATPTPDDGSYVPPFVVGPPGEEPSQDDGRFCPISTDLSVWTAPNGGEIVIAQPIPDPETDDSGSFQIVFRGTPTSDGARVMLSTTGLYSLQGQWSGVQSSYEQTDWPIDGGNGNGGNGNGGNDGNGDGRNARTDDYPYVAIGVVAVLFLIVVAALAFWFSKRR